MKRLVRTSQGWIELDVDKAAWVGLNVRVSVFSDGGWASAEEWITRVDPAERTSLETSLTHIAGIPVEEASQIVEESVREWRERGGEDEYRRVKRKFVPVAATAFGLVGFGALALLALIVLLVLLLVLRLT